MAQIPVFNRGCQNKSTYKSRFYVVKVFAEKVSKIHADGRKDGREETGRKIRNAEQFKSRQQLPIEKNRLVIPVLPVNARREPIPCGKHLLCRFRVIHFNRIRYGKQSVADKIQHDAKDSQNGKNGLF